MLKSNFDFHNIVKSILRFSFRCSGLFLFPLSMGTLFSMTKIFSRKISSLPLISIHFYFSFVWSKWWNRIDFKQNNIFFFLSISSFWFALCQVLKMEKTLFVRSFTWEKANVNRYGKFHGSIAFIALHKLLSLLAFFVPLFYFFIRFWCNLKLLEMFFFFALFLSLFRLIY